MREIEFVSYTGEYPCLCIGTLTLKIDGKEMSFKGEFHSGGTCYFDEDWDEHVTEGDWEALNLTDEEKEEITLLFNVNVEHGCCGGCL